MKIQKGFLGTFDEFMEEFKSLCTKYGHDQWFVGVSSANDQEHDRWDGGSNAVSESMVEYLEEMKEQMQEFIDNSD